MSVTPFRERVRLHLELRRGVRRARQRPPPAGSLTPKVVTNSVTGTVSPGPPMYPTTAKPHSIRCDTSPASLRSRCTRRADRAGWFVRASRTRFLRARSTNRLARPDSSPRPVNDQGRPWQANVSARGLRRGSGASSLCLDKSPRSVPRPLQLENPKPAFGAAP